MSKAQISVAKKKLNHPNQEKKTNQGFYFHITFIWMYEKNRTTDRIEYSIFKFQWNLKKFINFEKSFFFHFHFFFFFLLFGFKFTNKFNEINHYNNYYHEFLQLIIPITDLKHLVFAIQLFFEMIEWMKRHLTKRNCFISVILKGKKIQNRLRFWKKYGSLLYR